MDWIDDTSRFGQGVTVVRDTLGERLAAVQSGIKRLGSCGRLGSEERNSISGFAEHEGIWVLPLLSFG